MSQKQQNNQLVTLKTSPGLLSPQKKQLRDIYLGLTKPGNNVERNLILYNFDGRPLSEALNDPEFSDEIIDLLGAWRTYTGSITKVDPEGKLLLLELMYLCQHFPNLTNMELKFLIELSTLKKLPEVDPFLNIVFCAAYMAHVINAYYSFKKRVLADVIKEFSKLQLENNTEITPKQRTEDMRQIFEMLYNSINSLQAESKTVWFSAGLIGIGFDYLERINSGIFTPELKQEAMQYAEKMARADGTEEKGKRLYYRQYYLVQYFQNKTLEMTLKDIKPEHFQ